MRPNLALMVGLWFLAPALARAADCANAVTQYDMDQCAAEDFTKADMRLHGTYQRVIDRLKGNSATLRLLSAAQKAWLGFRDAECDFTTSASAGGSVHPMVVANCRSTLTTDRTKMLQAYLDCQEGDLSCPLPPP